MPEAILTPSAIRADGARTAQPLLVLNLAGTQQAMGAQHGQLLREAGGYQDVLEYYPRMPESILCGANSGDFEPLPTVLRPLIETGLRRLSGRRPEVYRRRALAFARALGLPPEFTRYMFVMDIMQNVINLAARVGVTGKVPAAAARSAVPACSSLAVWGAASQDGTLLHARNFDFPGVGVWERRPTVVFCKPNTGLRYGFVTTRGADVPGVTAFNEAGITLTAHTCFHKHARFRGMGIVDLGHEIIRKAESLEDALAIARARPVASTWAFLISSAREQRAISIDINARQVEAVEPNPGEPFKPQTNRYQHESLRRGQVTPSEGFIANANGRFGMLRRHALEALAAGGFDVHGLQAMLGSQAATHGERMMGGVIAQGCSVKSIVSQPEARRIHVSVGPCPTGGGPYVAVDWTWDRPVGWFEIGPEQAGGAVAELAPARRLGQQCMLDAVRMESQRAPLGDVARALEQAVQHDPNEPSYRLLAGSLRARGGEHAEAVEHFRAGLEREEAPFYRGQLLLWGARAADAAGERDAARTWREELLRGEQPLLEGYRNQAARELRRPFPARKLRKLHVNLNMPDVLV